MLKSLQLTLVAALISLLVGCQTIEIINDHNKSTEMTPLDWTWNHTGIFGLVNYSDDFQIADLCQGKEWSMVSSAINYGPLGVELGVGILANIAATSSAAGAVSFFWSPRSVAWQCAN